MTARRPVRTLPAAKSATGIQGLDTMTLGGFPRGRTTLLIGGPGTGKTVLALQFLVHGARNCSEAGIFVALEESSERVLANAASFGWKISGLRRNRVVFMDALPTPDLVRSGDFDLSGMLAGLGSLVRQVGARRIVFDALDIVLDLLPDAAARRRELYRLHDWLTARGLTAVITAKADAEQTNSISQQPFRDMLFMMDCAVLLNHAVLGGVSERTLRIQKYRGSSFDEDESPFVIGKAGLEVAITHVPLRTRSLVSKERISSGIPRLDTMLGGGYYRGASVLITGFAGTAKTTLVGAFAEAACDRGERTFFVSFDSDGPEVVRNLASVRIRLARHVRSGTLHIMSARSIAGSAETYLARIKALATEHEARCLIIDPISTWSRSGGDQTAHRVAEQLIDWSKARGTTVIFTRLLDEVLGESAGAPALPISTLADTWIDLNYLQQDGERNRGLAIIKSRGTAHSNQVRELILSNSGVTLADAYSATGRVLVGSMRWQREYAERMADEANDLADAGRREKLDTEAAEIEKRLQAMQIELAAKRDERQVSRRKSRVRGDIVATRRSRLGEMRGADVVTPGRK